MADCDNWAAWYDQMPPGPPRLIVNGDCHFTGASEVELQPYTPPSAAADGMMIRGPLMAARTGPPPMFQVNPGTNKFFSVEMASDPGLFDFAAHANDRTAANFYGSWQDGLLRADGETTYTLPDAVWERLKPAEMLAYRMITSAKGDKWENIAVTVPDAEAVKAPVLFPGDTDIAAPQDAETFVLIRRVRVLAPPAGGGGTLTLTPARFAAAVGMTFKQVLIVPDKATVEIARDVF